MTNEVIESAKALQASAKATSDAIRVIEKAGGFFNRIFGGLLENSVGVVADKDKNYRLERAVELAEKAEKILKDRGIGVNLDETNAVPPKVAIPLIENATLEDDEYLHTLWARLLANAMDPNFGSDINHVHVSILKELEPIDVMILNNVYSEKIRRFPNEKYSEILFEKPKIVQSINSTENIVELSLLNLMRVGCIKPGVRAGGVKVGGHALTVYEGTDAFHLSELGASLCLSVRE